jgi:hypothetical protein
MARGAQVKKEWSVSGPLRALLWWPGVAFVLVLVDPNNVAWTIALAGLVLVALGFAIPMAWRRLRPVAVGVATRINQEAPTMEIDMPTMEIPPVNPVERAA